MPDQKTALITGASRGLGAEAALAIAAAGYAVIINYKSDESAASGVARGCGGNAIIHRADVGDPAAVIEMADMIDRKFGRLDAIINNAGISRDSLIIKTSDADWDAVMDANLKGAFNVIKNLSPLMIRSGGGHIINVSSRSGLRGKAGQAAYSSAKAALIGLTVNAALELSVYNIRVNAVLPGYMATGMGRANESAMKTAIDASLLKKPSSPTEAAGFIAWLIGTGAITGQAFTLDSRI